jgi:hypothetical protein
MICGRHFIKNILRYFKNGFNFNKSMMKPVLIILVSLVDI